MTIKDITFNCSKHFKDYPCSHRQWKHKGHCRYVHGYSRSFTFCFTSNELDEIINFEPLKKETLLKVVDLQLNRLRERLEAKGMELEINNDVLSLITEIGYNPTYGARPLKRVIQKELETEIAKHILKGKYKEGSTIKIENKNSKLIFQ